MEPNEKEIALDWKNNKILKFGKPISVPLGTFRKKVVVYDAKPIYHKEGTDFYIYNRKGEWIVSSRAIYSRNIVLDFKN